MASFQRLALYLVFDALERDMINFLRRSLPTVGSLLTEEERLRARDRIVKRERQDLYNLGDDFDLLHGLDLGDKFSVIHRYKSSLPSSEATYVSSIKSKMDKAVPVRNDVMHGRPLTVDDYVFGFSFANQLGKRADIWPELAASLSALNENRSSILSKIVMTIDEERSTAVLNNLPRVDFDDTGFMPRPQLEADLKKKILGRHPVVTVLGDGGNGKTALMLQTAYRLVFSQDHSFDAIIWISAKGSELTTKEIKRISDAITNSIEIFEKVAEFEPGVEDSVARVRRLLAENKILLIIDNLETVLDQRIRAFSEDIPGESKLVFTSRVPLGGDLSVRVGTFTAGESERYLRRLIDAYGIDTLRALPSESVQKFVKLLKYKPLLIKWFAIGVLSGLAPESITRNPEIALRFCLENVIDTLSAEAKKVAMAFALASGSHSAIIIQYLTELSARDAGALA